MIAVEELAERFPLIDWWDPVPVTVMRTGAPLRRWCCRICIAQQGLHASDLDIAGYVDRDECLAHISAEHPKERES